MSAKSIAPVATDPTAGLIADLGFAPARIVRPTRPRTALDYRRDVDLAIIEAAGEIIAKRVPEKHRAAVSKLIANQLHHLSTPALGWPSAVLPTPDRSDWR